VLVNNLPAMIMGNEFDPSLNREVPGEVQITVIGYCYMSAVEIIGENP